MQANRGTSRTAAIELRVDTRLCILLLACGIVSGCGSQASPPRETELQRPDAELRAALDEAYPGGWRFAELAAFHLPDLRADDDPGRITGDFDGDGQLDYAAHVVIHKPGHTAGVDSAQILLAFLRRPSGFERHVLTVGGGPHAGSFLALAPRGTTVAAYDGTDSLQLEADGIHLVFPVNASVAYVYRHGQWLEIYTGD